MKTLKISTTLSIALFAIGLSFAPAAHSTERGGTGYGGGEDKQPTIPKNARNGLTAKDLEGMFQRCLLTGSPLSKARPLLVQFYENVYGKELPAAQMFEVQWGGDSLPLSSPKAQPFLTILADRQGSYASGTYQFETAPGFAGAGTLFAMKDWSVPSSNDRDTHLKTPAEWGLIYSPMYNFGSYIKGGQAWVPVQLYDVPTKGAITDVVIGPLGSFKGTLAVEQSTDKWGNITEGQETLLDISVNVPAKTKITNAKNSEFVIGEVDLTDYRNCLNSELQAATARASVKNAKPNSQK